MNQNELDRLSINTIRFLAVDAVQNANSGHPGMPLDAAPMAYVLWTRTLKHNPADPRWIDRDRFVLSAGHASALLYALLHLTGYEEMTLVYLENAEPHRRVLDGIRRVVRDARHVATCLGFGPRFLHSTGQVYKGGPNTGVFLQLTCDAVRDLPVAGKRSTFGVVETAQARGDLRVLTQRHRRALRVHLGVDVGAGLQALAVAVAEELG